MFGLVNLFSWFSYSIWLEFICWSFLIRKSITLQALQRKNDYVPCELLTYTLKIKLSQSKAYILHNSKSISGLIINYLWNSYCVVLNDFPLKFNNYFCVLDILRLRKFFFSNLIIFIQKLSLFCHSWQYRVVTNE